MVSKAGSLLQSRISELALCIAYPDSTLMSGLPLVKSEKKERVLESSVRFSTKESGHPVLSVPDVVFSVNKPILLHGVTIYGGSDSSYKYKMSLFRQAQDKNPVAITEGSFSLSDYYGESYVNLLFKEPVKIEVGSYNYRTFNTTYMYMCICRCSDRKGCVFEIQFHISPPPPKLSPSTFPTHSYIVPLA